MSRNKGFVIGALTGLSVLNIFQIIYLSRLNWDKIAKEVKIPQLKISF